MRDFGEAQAENAPPSTEQVKVESASLAKPTEADFKFVSDAGAPLSVGLAGGPGGTTFHSAVPDALTLPAASVERTLKT